jgi:hypothetical protein
MNKQSLKVNGNKLVSLVSLASDVQQVHRDNLSYAMQCAIDESVPFSKLTGFVSDILAETYDAQLRAATPRPDSEGRNPSDKGWNYGGREGSKLLVSRVGCYRSAKDGAIILGSSVGVEKSNVCGAKGWIKHIMTVTGCDVAQAIREWFEMDVAARHRAPVNASETVTKKDPKWLAPMAKKYGAEFIAICKDQGLTAKEANVVASAIVAARDKALKAILKAKKAA